MAPYSPECSSNSSGEAGGAAAAGADAAPTPPATPTTPTSPAVPGAIKEEIIVKEDPGSIRFGLNSRRDSWPYKWIYLVLGG